MNGDTLSRYEVINEWLEIGISDLFFAFKLNESYSNHSPLFLAIGLEMICKSYILGHKYDMYEGLPIQKGLKEVDIIARNENHNLGKMLKSISNSRSNNDVSKLLGLQFDRYRGDEVVNFLEAAYNECRYPVPNPIYLKYPIRNGNIEKYWNPIQSSSLEKFTHAVTRQILNCLKKDFGILLNPEFLDRLHPRRTLVRFKRILFNSERGYIARRKAP